MIELRNISREFRDGRRRNKVLKDISLKFPEKGLYAIYGKSGSGKTTLLNILGGLDKPNSGKIIFNGEECSYISDDERNKKIGFIFQNYYLERDATIQEVLENQMHIAGFTDKEQISHRSEIVLDLVKLARFKQKTTNSLSGGQKQRVAIARALIKGADVILADEPTGNLDGDNTHIVMDILKEISKTKLVILVTHEQNLIEQYSDAHIELVDGEVKFENKKAEEYVTGYENNSIVFDLSKAKHTGRLYTIKNIRKANRASREEKLYSTGNVFKQLFIISLAILLAFFSMKIFDYSQIQVERKVLNKNQVLVKISDYSEIKKLNRDLYDRIDYFTLNSTKGKFTMRGLPKVGVIEETYSKKSITSIDEANIISGTTPKHNEILISEGLAKKIKKQIKLKTIKSNTFVSTLEFDGKYKVVGLVKDQKKSIYFSQEDYLNTIGLYENLEMLDTGVIVPDPHDPTKTQILRSRVYFGDGTEFARMSTAIKLSDIALADDEAIIEINRAAMYKIDATVPIETANADLIGGMGKIQIKNSKVFVKQIRLQPTGSGLSDMVICVSKNTLNNLLSQISPNLEKLKESSNSENTYFLISAKSNEQMKELNKAIESARLYRPNTDAYYEKQERIEKNKMQPILLIIFGSLLLELLIYYFIEKSESIKNRKEYGVLRAIGVSKRNLLYRELVNTSQSNFITLSVCYFLSILMILTRYLILGVSVGYLVLIAFAMCVGVVSVLTLLSLLPYIFVVNNTPAKILARYDI